MTRRRGRSDGMASYRSRVEADIGRWLQAGIIDAVAADRLREDVRLNERKSISFGSVLMIMAALLFGAAILLIIAANWEAFPRIGRVGALFALIFAGYVGGALAKMRDHGAIGEGLWLIAAIAFGGAIALIGQMYHLSGDEQAAILTWCAGVALAALALRSGPLTMLAVVIAAGWMLSLAVDLWSGTPFPLFYPLIALALWIVSIWTRSRASRHLILVSLVLFMMLGALDMELIPWAGALALVSGLLFAAALAAPALVDRILMLNGRLPLHGLIGFRCGMALLQYQFSDESLATVIAALVVFGAVAAALVLAGRESRALRWVAYAGFVFELGFVYVATVGTMLGTAGLFFASGFVLAAVAFLIIRIEKRLMAKPAGEVAA